MGTGVQLGVADPDPVAVWVPLVAKESEAEVVAEPEGAAHCVGVGEGVLVDRDSSSVAA